MCGEPTSQRFWEVSRFSSATWLDVGRGVPVNARWALSAVIVGSGIVFLDGTIVTVALPAIGESLRSPRLGVLEAQSYIYNAYLLTLSALLIPAGVLTDAHGRRRMFVLGLIGFGATSALCGLAPTLEWLIAGRILQGAAGALLIPGSLAIITSGFQGTERARAFGLWAGASGITAIIGPVIGGVLVDSVSWRAAFFLNLPLVAFAWWAAVRGVAESRDPNARRIDWLGAFLSALAVGGLVLGLIRGQETNWDTPVAFAAIAVGVGASIATYRRVRSGGLIPLELFESRVFKVINVTTLLIYGGLSTVLYFLTIFLQGSLGYTATTAGLASVPAILFLAALSHRVGKWAGDKGPRGFLTVGPGLMGIGAWMLSLIPASSSAWTEIGSPPQDYTLHVLPGILVFGVGAMLMVAPLTEALMGSVDPDHAGIASAFNNAVSRIGPQLASAVIFIAVTAIFYGILSQQGVDVPDVRSTVAPLNRPAPGTGSELVEASRRASTEAFGVAMWVSASLLFAGAVTNLIGLKHCRPSGIESVTLAGQTCVPVEDSS